MRRTRYRSPGYARRLLAAGALGLLPASPVGAQPPGDAKAVHLSPGVLVDPARGRAYLMAPDGGVESVDLAGNTQVWKNKAASKPLGMAGGSLICQGELAAGEHGLKVVTVNPANGEKVASSTTPLPAGVRASVTATQQGHFVARARGDGPDTVVTWQYHGRPKRGLPPGTEQAVQPTPGGAPATPVGPAGGTPGGTFRINTATGAAAPAAAGPAEAPVPKAAVAAAAPQADRVAAVKGAQFLSADGRHVLASQRTGDERQWDKYTLTVYERGTGNRLGSFRSHLATVPFVVQGARAVFETGPFSRRVGEGVVSDPPKLHSVDLETGKEVWSRAVGETNYRGPSPP